MRRLALLLLVLAGLAPAAASRSAQAVFINASVENYANQEGPPAPMKWVRIEYDDGARIELKPVDGGYRQVISIEQPRAASVMANRDGRLLMLPIWLQGSAARIDFTLVDGNEPYCDLDTRLYIAERQDAFRYKLDTYFIARRLVEKNTCDTNANRVRVEQSYFARACDLSRANANIRMDPKAIDRLRRQNKPDMTARANRALERCAYRQTGDM